MKKAGRQVEYHEYPDEGHGSARPENRPDFYARAEDFLARHLGGRCEPVRPDGHAPATNVSSGSSAMH